MKIGALARRSGLSAHTLRYYERIGLLPHTGRDASGHRDYDAAILVWIDFLHRLRTTGMPIREMRRYAALRAEGDGTIAARRALLEAHRTAVRARVDALQASLLALDAKIDAYGVMEKTDAHGVTEKRTEPDDRDQIRKPPRTRPARPR